MASKDGTAPGLSVTSSQPGSDGEWPNNTIQYNNNICTALFMKRPGALTETSDDMLCEIVQSLNGA